MGRDGCIHDSLSFPKQKKKRRRIDRTMIGEPMNFVHLTHIGSGEMGAGDGLAMVREKGEMFVWSVFKQGTEQ